MGSKQLIYFDSRGRAEIIRLVLAVANEKYDDKRITKEEWPTLKETIKCGQLPVLRLEDGREMNESTAIAKYLAKGAKLCGKDDWEDYLINRAIDTINDIMHKLALSYYENDPTKKADLEKEMKEKHVPHYFGVLTKYIEEGHGDFLAGIRPTLADLALLVIVDYLEDVKSHFPKIDAAYKKTVDAFPTLKTYLANRKPTLH